MEDRIESTEKNNMMTFGLTPQLPYSVQEAINRLRINISFLGSDVRRIMIISSEPNEGKSFVTLNLWNQMAEAGEKTLYMDADMRNSTFYSKYDLKRDDGKDMKGLSHYLAGSAELDEVLMHTKYGDGDVIANVENVINPSMLLENGKLDRLLEAMASEYRYVFVDAPPLGLVSDGERLGNMCDGAILCIRSGFTPKGVVRNSIRQLERAGCPLLGMVLNRVDETKAGYYHGQYGKYYYGKKYYGGYGDADEKR